jgi:predicted 3-demethylubiquinone-9 3-methyltransferase (glyoxalase superfamily)
MKRSQAQASMVKPRAIERLTEQTQNASGEGEEPVASKMTNCLWFDHGDARKAAEFYASIFPNSRVGPAMAAPGDYPDGQEGAELTVEFTVLGVPFMGLNGGPNFKPNEAVSFVIETQDQAETDRYWDAIVGAGGAESACGWCKDRWGFSWQITPRQLNEGMADPDKAAAKRVFEAMMTMKKIDVATIEAARRGGG